MTDTITRPIVDGTIAALNATLTAARERLASEEAEYTAKRDAMVSTAHRLGTRNGIGPALDDLLEEFGLPRRRPLGTLSVVLLVSGPLRHTSTGYTLHNGTAVYHTPSFAPRLTWPLTVGFDTQLPEGASHLCEDPVPLVREWLSTYYGEAAARPFTFQIGRTYCDSETGAFDCEHDEFPVTEQQAADIDWTTIPVHKVDTTA